MRQVHHKERDSHFQGASPRIEPAMTRLMTSLDAWRVDTGAVGLEAGGLGVLPRLSLLPSLFVVVAQHVHGRGDGGADIREMGADPLVVSGEQHLCRGLLGRALFSLQDLLNQGVRLLRDVSRRFDDLLSGDHISAAERPPSLQPLSPVEQPHLVDRGFFAG